MKMKRDMWQVTSDQKNNAARRMPSRHVSTVTRHPEQAVALIITVIMLAVVTFLAITFLAVSRRERNSVTTTTDTATAQLAADDALAAAEAQIMANTLASTNPYNFGLLVSTNYINPYGFVAGVSSPTNVSYYNHDGTPVSPGNFPQLLANLYYLPRPPVFATNYIYHKSELQFYLDLNRNGTNEANGWQPEIAANGEYIHQDGSVSPDNFNVLTNFQVGDPEWIGVLQHPDQPYGPNNPFVARYAFVAVPIGNALDLNAIYNDAMGIKAGSAMTPANDGFMRNQGVGSWEINLAAFLTDLNTNLWDPPTVENAANNPYNYLEPNFPNKGAGFEDALSLLSYRYATNYNTLRPVGGINPRGIFTTDTIFPPFRANIDYYSDGPLMTTPAGISELFPPQNVRLPWSGADNTNHFFDIQDLFDPAKANIGATSATNSFTSRLLSAGVNSSTYDRYTYYRLLSQMGVDSAPEQDQINLNYSNAAAYFYPDGVLSNITYYPDAETNLTLWQPLQFFTIAADKMLRTYSEQWITESPSNYAATYGMVTNISTAADPILNPTNIPVPFGISDIPVVISNRFVYTPAIQRVLQLAANIYDATTNNTTVMGMNFPSVFRPIFNLVPVRSPFGEIIYTNVYVAGYEPVEYEGQIGAVAGTNDYQLALPVTIADLLDTAYQNFNYGYSGPFGSGLYTNVNVYGVPWIIGAKKGFPNFNEFAMESVFQLTRKVQVTRLNTNDSYSIDPGDFSFNQMFNLSISNQFAVEYWNSYTNDYLRPLVIFVTNVMTGVFFNDEGFTNSLYCGIGGSRTILPADYGNNGWPGYNPNRSDASYSQWYWSPYSFQIPLDTNVAIITNSTYRFNQGTSVQEPGVGPGPYLTTNVSSLPYEPDIVNPVTGLKYPQPHWMLSTTNDLQAYILDTPAFGPAHVIDYVQLAGPNSVRDLTSEINANYYKANIPQDELWDTNLQDGVPLGLLYQVELSAALFGQNTSPDSPNVPWYPSTDVPTQNAIDAFRVFFDHAHHSPIWNNASGQRRIAAALMTNAMAAPYQPYATMVQITDWQVNDPLVHYLAEDIGQPGMEAPVPALAPPTPMPTLTNGSYATIGYLNKQRYMPWGVSVSAPSSVDANPYNLALKDPLVRRSDDWDFPAYKLPTIGWLGRVHRGTPWQSIYLKSPDILHEIQVTKNLDVLTTNVPYMGTNTWVRWTGDTQAVTNQEMNDLGLITNHFVNYFDAANMAPVQDRLLFDLFTTAPNANATRGTLSVNVGAGDTNNLQAGLAAWSALFSGVQVLSNNAADSAVNPTVFTDRQHNGSLANFTTFPVNPAGPAGTNAPVGEIVRSINLTRANVNNTVWFSSIQSMAGGAVTIADEIPATFANANGLDGAFEHVGDILAVPQLSVQSPFLNWDSPLRLPNGATYQQANGISDEMYDWLPQQVLSLLRVSGTPQSPMRYVIYCYGQALKPAPNGIYTGGLTLANGQSAFGMVTNYQVVAESANRAVVNFGSVVTNIVTVTNNTFYSFTNLITTPMMTNNTAQIKQFNVLPPY